MKASFFSELKKRRVYRAAVAYAVVAWGVTEILEGVIGGLGWPDWLATLAVILFVMGFPVAMFLAWVYDWTPEGIRRSAPSGPLGWLPIAAAVLFLLAGSGGLFWLINPSGVVRVEQVGVAVLPCRYRGDPARAFRGDGIAEILNNRLARSGELFVPDFMSTLEISESNQPTAQFARNLRVSWLIDCRVTEADDRVNISASIIDVSTDESSPLFDSDMRSLEIGITLGALETAVFSRLGLVSRAAQNGQLAAQLTSSLEALDHFLMGQRSMRAGDKQSLQAARQHFGDAQLAGAFPLARLREADAMLALFELDPPATASAQNTALKAVSLILDEVGQGDAVPAGLYASRLRLANLADQLGVGSNAGEEQRRAWFEQATAFRPSFAEPYFLYADYLESIGRDDEASEYLARAKHLAPATQ